MYADVARWWSGAAAHSELELVWHGAEPLEQPAEFFWNTFAIQRRSFGARRIRNAVQTRLTRLDPARLQLLEQGFDRIEVVLDLFGASTQLENRATLANLDRLRMEKLAFGCVVPLTASNAASIRKAVRFVDLIRASHLRVVAEPGAAELAIEACQAIFEELLALEHRLRVDPIQRYVEEVIARHSPAPSDGSAATPSSSLELGAGLTPEPTPDPRVERALLDYIERRMRELGALEPTTRGLRLPRACSVLRHVERLPLQRDVRVHALHLDRSELARRIEINHGTEPPAQLAADGLEYVHGAIVPDERWRKPTEAECDALLASGPHAWDIAADVGVVRISDAVMAPLEAILEQTGARSALEPGRQELHVRHPAWARAYEALIDHVAARFALRPHTPRVDRFAAGAPGLRSVTRDTVIGRKEKSYVGLHLDSWEKVPAFQQRGERNRICVNLGREDRYFVFVNLSLRKLRELLGAPAEPESPYARDLGPDFLKAYPQYPVIRLRLRPREAYIAPTDNLLHDGSSVCRSSPDLALHLLGYFVMRKHLHERPQHLHPQPQR
ncbi:MAG TPA: hypothetical protein VJR89_14505 [Polyangiales bacterium]|nr:hypothetical protein [Polyangiales bacterium]